MGKPSFGGFILSHFGTLRSNESHLRLLALALESGVADVVTFRRVGAVGRRPASLLLLVLFGGRRPDGDLDEWLASVPRRRRRAVVVTRALPMAPGVPRLHVNMRPLGGGHFLFNLFISK